VRREATKRKPKHQPIEISGGFDGVPPVWFGIAFLLLGSIVFVVALICLGASLVGLRAGELIGTSIASLMGLVFALVGAWFVRKRPEMKACIPLEEVSRHLQAEPTEVEQLVHRGELTPRFIVNGRPLFHPADVGGAALLLRPMSDPAGDDLLRPAVSAGAEIGGLLRADRSTSD
jgi:hypothetical protein